MSSGGMTSGPYGSGRAGLAAIKKVGKKLLLKEGAKPAKPAPVKPKPKSKKKSK